MKDQVDPPVQRCWRCRSARPRGAAAPGSRGGERARADYSSRRAAGGSASCPPGEPMEPTEAAEEERLVQCPVCLQELPGADINAHLDRCLQAGGVQPEPPSKRPRLAAAPPGSQAEGQPEQARPAAGSPVFSLFHKGRGGGQSPAAAGGRSGAGRDEAAVQPGHGCAAALCGESLAHKLQGKPLAERLRPDTLGDYVGQEPVLGAQTLLRSLLESHEIPSLILWGPPGCGKVSAGGERPAPLTAAGSGRRCHTWLWRPVFAKLVNFRTPLHPSVFLVSFVVSLCWLISTSFQLRLQKTQPAS